MTVGQGEDDRLRISIGKMLADGLRTRTEPVPDEDAALASITRELAALEAGDLQGKLVVAGSVNHPQGTDQHRCLECMYYLVHRRFCELPELNLPVEPDWWCRLWRI